MIVKKIAYLLIFASLRVSGQNAPPVTGHPLPINFTAAQDHQNMMDQLGIKALRAGPGGNESGPNHANYDESMANPYPNLPEMLTLKNGKKVTSAAMWWHQRRPEIVEDMEREVYGRLPENLPKVTSFTTIPEKMTGSVPSLTKEPLVLMCCKTAS